MAIREGFMEERAELVCATIPRHRCPCSQSLHTSTERVLTPPVVYMHLLCHLCLTLNACPINIR